MGLLRPIQLVYSLVFKQKCEVVIHKLTIGILVNGKFVMFLSTKYIEDVYGISSDELKRATSTVDLSRQEIIKLVKEERVTRIKLNVNLSF